MNRGRYGAVIGSNSRRGSPVTFAHIAATNIGDYDAQKHKFCNALTLRRLVMGAANAVEAPSAERRFASLAYAFPDAVEHMAFLELSQHYTQAHRLMSSFPFVHTTTISIPAMYLYSFQLGRLSQAQHHHSPNIESSCADTPNSARKPLSIKYITPPMSTLPLSSRRRHRKQMPRWQQILHPKT
jgi:hypothetical protein